MYDLEKYRNKREKVLGIRKRGLSFTQLAAIVSLVIVLGMGAMVVPKAIAYFSTRNLDDAIYKLADSGTWDQTVVHELAKMHGVKDVNTDNKDTRLVITFNRQMMDTAKIKAFMKQQKVEADLLNTMGHRERAAILLKEAEFEAL